MSYSSIFWLIFFLIVLNAFFSTAEFSIVSSRKSKLQGLVNKGNIRAKDVLLLQENPTSFIVVIQIGLNIVAVLSGIFGEQSMVPILTDWFKDWGLDFKSIEFVSLVLVVFFITSLFILFGELIPKKLAYLNPEKFACLLIVPLKWVFVLTKPFVYVYAKIADFLLKLMNIDGKRINDMTFDDMFSVISDGFKSGLVEKNEYKIIKNVFSLTERSILSSMTSKGSVIYLDINDSPADIRSKIIDRPHSRFLVCDSEIDNVLGYVDSKDILKTLLNNKDVKFDREKLKEQGLKSVLILPDSINLLDVLDKFREARADLACVFNEFGMMQGLITLNDVLSTLMGSVLPKEKLEELIVKREDNSWLIDGKVSVEEVKKLFDWKDMDGSDNYQTISGFLMYQMKCLPKKAQKIEYKDVTFEIVDVEGFRIDEVMATKVNKKGESE